MQKLAAKHNTTVTQAEIQNYYNSHATQFGTQESRNIRVVLAKNQADAQAAKKALSSGQSWAAVAKKYSTDPTTKNSGGLLNGVTKQQADPALATAAFSAPVNKLIGPVKGQFGYYVFEVTQDHPGHPADARPGHAADPPAAHQPAVADQRADRGRQQRQEGLAQPDHVPRAVRDG